MASHSGDGLGKIPVLLLKTKSTPGDAYEDLFSSSEGSLDFEPDFVPVLEHRFEPGGMQQFDSLLQRRHVASSPDSPYGGLIFTSQRAVEAFAKLVLDGKGTDSPRTMIIFANQFTNLTIGQEMMPDGHTCSMSPFTASARPLRGH